MGSGPSKPSHEWSSSAVSGASQDLIQSLQSSNETDASRARLAELHVQKRVSSELQRLFQAEADKLREIQDKIAATPPSNGSSPLTTAKTTTTTTLDRTTVAGEIQDLREKLEKHKQVRALPDDVAEVRGKLVRCLREHDRRPLDCWQEVQAFKDAVQKLEKAWVDKVVS